MQYVFPIPNFLRGELLHCNRLYAYPTPPEPPAPNGIVILDSGAFGLSMRGGKMDASYMQSLAEFYQQHTSKQVFGIAPDVRYNPKQSIKNWQYWSEQGYPKVAPVIQSTRKGLYDYAAFRHQAQVYAEAQPEFLCFSNPGVRAEELSGIDEIVAMLRSITGARHIHQLGSGWSLQDIRGWFRLKPFDTMDSIAYYTSNESWMHDNAHGQKARSLSNAKLIQLIQGIKPK